MEQRNNCHIFPETKASR